MVINPLDVNSIINQYLYGQTSTPTNLDSDIWIRPENATTTLNISMQDYMNTAGRFALGAQFDFINDFFTYNYLNPGTYSKQQVAEEYGHADFFGFEMQQYDYADGTDDFAERVLIWNTVAYKVSDSAQFIVETDGTKRIENFAIEPLVDPENFDMTGGNLITNIANSELQSWIDPSGIGRTVNLDFTGSVVTGEYTIDDWNSDKTLMQNDWSTPTLLTTYNEVKALADELFASGVTDFRNSNGKPIWWDGDHIDDVRASYLESAEYLDDKTGSGVVLIGGKGSDQIIGGQQNDSLFGGDGADTIDGGAGDDYLEGGKGTDHFYLNGNDTVMDNGESDRIYFNSNAYTGTAIETGENQYELQGKTLIRSNNDLIIENGNDTITLKSWVDGDYGITLENGENERGKPNDEMTRALEDIIPASPIALDLDGSGSVEIRPLWDSDVYFDIDNDGFVENVAWIPADQGWLAMDQNGDGVINNQNELFGQSDTLLAYEKLRLLDSNQNNKIDAADTDWGNIRVWIDADQNGASAASELYTLNALNITELAIPTSGVLGSTFVRNGLTYRSRDVFLQTDHSDSWYVSDPSEIDPSALLLPASRGYGDVKSLEYALSESSALMTSMQQLNNLSLSELDQYVQILDTVISEWAGVSNVARTGSREFTDARQIAALETFVGSGESYFEDTQNLNIGSDYLIAEDYGVLVGALSTRFIAQGSLSEVFGNPDYYYPTDSLHFSIGYETILNNAIQLQPNDNIDKSVYWSEIARTLTEYADEFGLGKGAMKNAVNVAAGYNIELLNLSGHYLEGYESNDILRGNSSFNFIDGEDGDDNLIGGQGFDYLKGGFGSDTYYYALGDGNDLIFDFDLSNDTNILSLSNIDVSDVYFRNVRVYGTRTTAAGSEPWGIKVFVNDGGTITWYHNDVIDEVHFGDDTIFDTNDIFAKAVEGTSGDDNILIFGVRVSDGGAGNDTITGSLANDTLYGGIGDDLLIGNDGNDELYAGDGKDTLEGGQGNDYIGLTSDSQTDILLYKSANESNLSNGFGDYIGGFEQGFDKIDVSALGYTSLAFMNFAQFSDGNGGTITEIAGATGDGFYVAFAGAYTFTNDNFIFSTNVSVNIITGTNGNDSPLNGTVGDDIIEGLSGNDDIFANAGNDTIVSGAGNDYIVLGTGSDVIKVSSLTDSSYTSGVDYVGDFVIGEDKIDISALGIFGFSELGFYNSSSYTEIYSGDFALGFNGDYSFTASDFIFSTGASSTITGTNSSDSPLNGTSSNDFINALAGNDDIFAGDGDDTVISGAGIDYIVLGAGDDVLKISSIADSSRSTGVDYIGDFTQGQDKIDLSTLRVTDSSIFSFYNSATYTEIYFNDFAIGFSGDITFTQDDFIFATSSSGTDDDNILIGDASDNYITAFAGNDIVEAFAGNDLVYGGDGNDTLLGGDGDDQLQGEAGADSINGGAGNDTIFGQDGDDILSGDSGNDDIVSGAGDDIIFGGDGNDNIFASDGGNNTITGGQGYDYILLGNGADTIIINSISESALSNGTADYVSGFTNGTDVYDLSALGFSGFGDLTINNYGTWVQITAGDFAIGFEGTGYNFTSADFIFA